MGGRGRRTATPVRRLILGHIDKAVAAGAGIERCCEVAGLSSRTLQRWREDLDRGDRRKGPRTPPAHRLSDEERAAILVVVNSPEFRDMSPRQIVPLLADQGRFLGSESTMYRVLHDAGQMTHRCHARPARAGHPRELRANGPNQVWSWDITYLPSRTRGTYFYLYVVLDIWSRKIVAHSVRTTECAEHARNFLAQAIEGAGVGHRQLTIHSDNGNPMRSFTLQAKLEQRPLPHAQVPPHLPASR